MIVPFPSHDRLGDDVRFLINHDVIEKREWFNEPFDDYGENTVVPIYGFREDKRSSTGWCNVIEKYRVKLLPSESPVPNPFTLRNGRTKENPYAGF